MNAPPPPRPQLPLTVKGSRGQVTFDGWTVSIRHTGLGNRHTASVPLDQLSGVELRPASPLGSGMFTLLTAGTLAPQRRVRVNRNPLALWFLPGQSASFKYLHDTLLFAIQARRAPMPQIQHQPAPSLADELTRLADLVQRGLLSPGEFEQAKARLLGGPS
ncbi:SHOCT domain-containing protein [Streptomyces sp. NPDC052000]|uniref:SHOCT domain-containing protein n=1 Tax=Streptomyces sp. NPDC052000 TaxID=3155676 RepID=UPI00344B956F